MSTSDSNSDSKKEGLRLILRGGIRAFEDGTQKKQEAIIEFVCDKDKEGTEGEVKPSDEYDDTTNAAALLSRGSATDPLLFAADEGGDGNGDDKEPKPTGPVQLGPEDRALIFESYGALDSDKNIDVLRLTWKTKHACENAADNGDEMPSKSWGFFTWIVILYVPPFLHQLELVNFSFEK